MATSLKSRSGVRAARPVKPERTVSRGLLRISDLAAKSGVPLATIKYYIREGLVPSPKSIGAGNIGYYEPAVLNRLAMIRKLREERFLPLRVIKSVLDDRGAGTSLSAAERSLVAEIRSTVIGALAHSSASHAGVRAAAVPKSLSRPEALARYSAALASDFDLLEQLGLIAPISGAGDSAIYGEDDVRLLATLEECHQAGLSRDLFPLEGLGHYAELIGELVAREVKLFARATRARTGSPDVAAFAVRAFELTEQLVVNCRRNLMRQALSGARRTKLGSIAEGKNGRSE